ncbi:MAG: hypothetical protein ACRDPA_18315, partial [Solirubrobacteraceae bacterium]
VAASGESVHLRTDRELEVLYELSRWALEHDVRITGLTVSRHTLEDVYLQLTGADAERFQPDSAPGEPARA